MRMKNLFEVKDAILSKQTGAVYADMAAHPPATAGGTDRIQLYDGGTDRLAFCPEQNI